MRRFGMSLIVLALAALGVVRAPAVSADAPVGAVQLRAITSTHDGTRTAVLKFSFRGSAFEPADQLPIRVVGVAQR